MKLRELTNVIDGTISIMIYNGPKTVFNGAMHSISKEDWDNAVGNYMDYDVLSINLMCGILIIAI